MGKVIRCILKKSSITGTTLVITQHTKFYTKTQHSSDCESSVCAHALSSSVSDKITIHKVNTDVNNNNDSKLFETIWKNNLSYSSFGNTTTTMTTPNSS